MTSYAGKTITILAAAEDRVTKYSVSSPTCTVDFFIPPKNPKNNPTDRVVDYSYTATFDSDQQKYVVDVSTGGWPGGSWWYRVTLTSGSNSSEEYFNFKLLP